MTNISNDDANQSPEQIPSQAQTTEETIQHLKDELFDSQRRSESLNRTIKAHYSRLIEIIEQFEPLIKREQEKAENEKYVSYLENMITELKRTLALEGIAEHQVETGCLYDPSYFRIVAVEIDEEKPDHTILRVVRPVYLWNGNILKKGAVIVSQKPTEK